MKKEPTTVSVLSCLFNYFYEAWKRGTAIVVPGHCCAVKIKRFKELIRTYKEDTK